MLMYLVKPIIVNVVILTTPKKNPRKPYITQPVEKKKSIAYE